MNIPTNEKVIEFFSKYALTVIVVIIGLLLVKWLVFNPIISAISRLTTPTCTMADYTIGDTILFGNNEYSVTNIDNYKSIGEYRLGLTKK